VRAQRPGEQVAGHGQVLVTAGHRQPRLDGVHQVEPGVAAHERQLCDPFGGHEITLPAKRLLLVA
jgi:hypothetical protein